MKTKLIPLFFGAMALMGCGDKETQEAPAKPTVDVDAMIGKMSLEQKAKLVVGTGMDFHIPDSILSKMPKPPVDPDTAYADMVKRIRTYLPGAAGNTSEYPEIGITTQVLADGPAGLRISPTRKDDDNTYYCTAFPIATVLASTWDTELVNEVGKTMGKEVLEYGADVLLAPGMNIQRDPLCGRNFEYYSEDPLVTGKMAAAMVNGIQSNGVGTSVKHFAANNQETNRMSTNTVVSERALREIYLKGFEIAVKESQPWTVMSAYNKINGQYVSESKDLLTNILREDWGFEGYVMTDWGGGSDIVTQMEAGNDLIMPGQKEQIETLIKAVEENKMDEAILDKNIKRILEIMVKTPRFKGYDVSGKPNLKKHAEVTRQAATDGMVLLENKDNTLPLTDVKQVAVFGTTSYDFISGGTGSGDVNEAYTISLIDGLKNGGFQINDALQTTYEAYIKDARAKQGKPDNWLAAIMGAKDPVAEMPIKAQDVSKAAESSEIALITIGRNSGEGGDRKPEAGDFYLTNTEKQLIAEVTKTFHAAGKKAIVVLNVGGVVETKSWAQIPDAVLCAWQPGQEAGNSVVDVISGKVNPSGKLAISFPIKYEDAPSSKSFPGYSIEGETGDEEDLSGFSFMRRVPWETVYEEDIYVGYRYYNTFEVPVAYEFGYGLSYTNFEYSNMEVDKQTFTDELLVSVTVKNTGTVAGREVVQLYLSAPTVILEKPEQELVAFGKTKMLAPGATETLHFVLRTKDLASFDVARSSWIVEAGDYELKVGASSTKINGTAKFNVAQEILGDKVHKALVPQADFKKLSRN
ncbi:glycoside hydrolase family 3 protein [Mangrovimonas sp. DI 80]|uniref:beta-glucosidase n=1 Tax=Mangrovimonas sp. DI 80 TaxID=1779330 RepID=UPI0009788B36|nr:glycoside hydrolase family 3 protein [Mangrovimonas sp. DI 80]OMP32838.1 glycosyl hydrolase [Mangrovimonas sp. DI 80]